MDEMEPHNWEIFNEKYAVVLNKATFRWDALPTNNGKRRESKGRKIIMNFYTLLNKDTLDLSKLTLSQTKPGFYKSFENTVGKGEIAHNEQFLLFQQFFLPI